MILAAAAVLGVLVAAQTFVLISGNFDLSTESTLGLAALVGVWLIVPAGIPTNGAGIFMNPYLSIIFSLSMGALIGYIIGCLITYGNNFYFMYTYFYFFIFVSDFDTGSPSAGSKLVAGKRSQSTACKD